MCFNATSSVVAGGCAYGVAWYLLRKENPRLKWSGLGLIGITAMQWVEWLLWLDGPKPHGAVNQLLTVALIPAALVVQVWGPLFGSTFDRPIRGRRILFYGLLILALVLVVLARVVYQPTHTQVTPEGHLNWFSPRNPPVFEPWTYGLWALVIGAPFLLWWRPLWQAGAIVAWGWLWSLLSFLFTDSAASHWCFFVTFYAAFVLIYSFMAGDGGLPDSPRPMLDPAPAARPNIET